MSEESLNILRSEVESITKKIVEHNEEAMRLDVIRAVLQREIELYEPIKIVDNELPF